MAKELFEHENKLQALSVELTLAEERERHRIASGIHDEIAQKLVMAKFELQKLQQGMSDLGVSKVLGSLCDRIDEMVRDADSLTFELSSPLLYTVGLSVAVESWMKQHVRSQHGINCNFISNLSTLCLDLEVRVTLFQAIRELLMNVIKHARARNVKVNLHEFDDRVEISVEDDGVGFDATKILETLVVDETGHFGLFSLMERINYLGGNFDIVSVPGHGTRVTIAVAKKYNMPLQKHLDSKEPGICGSVQAELK